MTDAQAREMAELRITFNGRRYGDRGYRYDRWREYRNERLADALAYAERALTR